MAQSVARRLGKAEVTGSSPANSFKTKELLRKCFFCVLGARARLGRFWLFYGVERVIRRFAPWEHRRFS